MNDLGVTPQVTLLILIVLLLVCSAFFSASETALMSVNRIRLRQIAKKHQRSVKIVEGVLEKPEKLIGTILLGNNLVNVAMSAIATAIALSLWGDTGIIYVTAALTVIILIFAEITPKVYAKYHSERISIITAPILEVVMTIFRPVTVAVIYIAQKLLLLLGIDITKTKRTIMTEAEVKAAINIGWEDGSITSEEKEMLSRIFTLNDKSVADVMVPKKRLVTLRSDYTIDQALRTIKRNGYSRYPVRQGKSQEIIGFIHAKDLLGKKGNKKLSSMKMLIRPAYFIPENKKINSQLRHFKGRKLHQAIALNEQGEVKGLITLEDILEQMVGSIEDEYDV
jgi:Mg2+/Co2+ transporter CorB